jgi:hypothetical protein
MSLRKKPQLAACTAGKFSSFVGPSIPYVDVGREWRKMETEIPD